MNRANKNKSKNEIIIDPDIGNLRNINKIFQIKIFIVQFRLFEKEERA